MQHIPSNHHFKRWRVALTAFMLWASGSSHALTVFACEPEWAALVQQLAPHSEVRSATHSRQDPHHIEARPSLIALLRKADLAVCTGAGLEDGWLPMLQQRSSNPRVQNGMPGMFQAADQVTLIDPRPPGTPFSGDVHPAGNPHIHLDPHRLLRVADALAKRLEQVDPANAQDIRARFVAFDADWRVKLAQWERRASSLRGMRVAAQHTTFAYLWRWLGIEVVADLEPKPGVPPSPGHLQSVLESTRTSLPRAVVVPLYLDARGAQWLAQQSGSRMTMLQLPATVTDEAPTNSLAGLFDHLVDRLLGLGR
jgi:zinc/manganese transport system substrate-binding protein